MKQLSHGLNSLQTYVYSRDFHVQSHYGPTSNAIRSLRIIIPDIHEHGTIPGAPWKCVAGDHIELIPSNMSCNGKWVSLSVPWRRVPDCN